MLLVVKKNWLSVIYNVLPNQCKNQLKNLKMLDYERFKINDRARRNAIFTIF